MQQTSKKKLIVIAVFLTIMIILAGWYYWEKIETLWANPKHFLNLLLDATQLSKITTAFIATTLLLPLGAVVIDTLVLGWDKCALNRLINNPSGSAKNDIWSFILSATKIYDVIVFFISFGLFYFLASIVVNYFNLNLGGYIVHPLLQFFILFIITDFKHYIGHRFMHYSPFWELHAFHHSAEEFNLITTTRGNFVEAGIYYFFTGIFFAIFGGGVEHIGDSLIIVTSVIILREFYQYILHSDVDWKFGWVGKYILISPMAHKLHHSVLEEDYNKNFSTFFIWWDRIFKTYKAPTDSIEIGIPDNPYNNTSFFHAQWIGVKRFINRLF